MHCPNCRYQLTKQSFEKTEVDHCTNCGGTLFEANEINRITLEDARKLALDKKIDDISGSDKISPTDGSVLERIDGSSIPQHVTLLQSKTTGEVFVYPDDLVNFKRAQESKVHYFSAWRIPVPTLKNVLVYSFVLLSGLSLVYISSRFQSPTSSTTNASNICINKNMVEKIDNGYILYCTTAAKIRCEARVFCAGEEKIIPLSENKYGTDHFTLIEENCDNAKVVCFDAKDEVQTEWILLQ